MLLLCVEIYNKTCIVMDNHGIIFHIIKIDAVVPEKMFKNALPKR